MSGVRHGKREVTGRQGEDNRHDTVDSRGEEQEVAAQDMAEDEAAVDRR